MAARKSASGNLKLASVLDLNEATTLHGKLMSMRGSNIVVDASDVERAGVQCFQVLVAAARAWEADKKTFTVDKASDAFVRTLQLTGIDTDSLVA